MSARWVPTDDELDAVARTLPAEELEPARAEQHRTNLLAIASTSAQPSRRSAAPFVIAGASIAAAAVLAVWLAVRPDGAPSSPHETIQAIGPARFERTSDWPSFVVRVDDGKLSIRVSQLAAWERFRVATADAEVEVRGTRFIVDAEGGHLTAVLVEEGRVEIRPAGSHVVILAAGESWTAPRTAQRDTIAPPAVANVVGSAALDAKASSATGRDATASPAAARDTKGSPATGRDATTRTTARDATSSSAAVRDTASSATARDARASSTIGRDAKTSSTGDASGSGALPALAKPGEAEFRAGWAALRGGDATAAAKSFAAACTAPNIDAIGEDACFWAGAAAKQAGQAGTARSALAEFIQRFPSSARAAEASALLGWLLYDAGDLDGAEARFKRAAGDRVPKVRDSAERGLTAIQRKRAAP